MQVNAHRSIMYVYTTKEISILNVNLTHNASFKHLR